MSNDNDHTFTVAQIKAKVPIDPAERAKFVAALEAVADIYPADDVEPLRSDVVHEGTGRLIAEGLDRFDAEDGTDWAEALADAYSAARADYAARSNPAGGNA